MQNPFTSGSLRPRVRFCGCKDRKYFSNYNGLRIIFFKTFSLFAIFGISIWHFLRVKVQNFRFLGYANSFNLNLKDSNSHPISLPFFLVHLWVTSGNLMPKQVAKNKANSPQNDVRLLFLEDFCTKICKQLKISLYLHTKTKKRQTL